ncbi:MAG TPA: glycosyltransferase family 1 protein [Lactovum miscens]|uniref:rhamnosyltransferase WsaF family glycosyltransferase n=1 Tax=Lactovum miscens TaxID=190387 RepID=UPI002ED7B3AB
MPAIKDILSVDFLENPYKVPEKLNKSKLKIGWIIPTVGPGGGGHLNIARFARYLQSRGHKTLFSIYDTDKSKQKPEAAEKILEEYYDLEVEVVRNDKLADCDVIFATSWETAYGLYGLESKAHKFYFVQDFEPYFFEIGSRYKLAEATYQFGFYGITAGKWLSKKVQQYNMSADYYNFGVNLDQYKAKKIIAKKKQILFYARPHTARRGYEIGILALSLFKKEHSEYEIIMVGQDLLDYAIPFEYVGLGSLPVKDLPRLYQESVACLVLSLTNVSLLPLELLASGCVPVMNSGENNMVELEGVEGIVYAEILPHSLAGKLSEVVERANLEEYAFQIANKIDNRSWNESLKKVEEIILREVTTID